MQHTHQHLCEISHCGKPAPGTTICHQCAEEVQRAIYQFINVELDRLHAIALGEEQPAEKTARPTHDASTSKDVLDLSTLELHHNITTTWPNLLDGLATNPNAEQLYWQIIAGCERAQTKINGDTDRYSPDDLNEANKTLSDPMKPTQLIEWLWETFRIRVTHDQLRQWKSRGKIISHAPAGKHNTYTPKAVLEAM